MREVRFLSVHVRTQDRQNDDQIRCRACNMWDETTRMRPGSTLMLLCDDCWYDWTRDLGICRYCGKEQ